MSSANTPTGKAPGPDGFTITYYKTFQTQLAAHFVTAFNAILDNHAIPTDILVASISVIPKPAKDSLLCASYRPISLLNCDLKLFTKILAERIDSVLQRIIPLDQAGFIGNREARDNTIRTINVVARAKRLNTPFILLSTDAEKAFDRVNWTFLLATLRRLGMPAPMLSWISAIYSSPTATVRVNGTASSPFKISKGTRQGCPLSPAPFHNFTRALITTYKA